MADAVAGVFGGIGVTIAQRPSGGPASRYVPKTKRAKDELGLEARIPLDAAINKTAHL